MNSRSMGENNKEFGIDEPFLKALLKLAYDQVLHAR